jgi:hypothetical protein
MSVTLEKPRRRFHAHASAHADALNGLPLAAFWQRLLGYSVDLFIAVFIWFPLEFAWRYLFFHERDIHLVWDFHEKGNVVVMVLYWGLANYFGNGQTPGKWVRTPDPTCRRSSWGSLRLLAAQASRIGV